VPEHDPDNEAYDPKQFMYSVESAAVVWAAEPRIEPWASEREQAIEAWLKEHLQRAAPDARLLEASCKKRVCRVALDVPESQLDNLGDRYPIMMLATSTEMSMGTGGETLFHLVYTTDLMGANDFAEYLKTALEALEQRKGDQNANGK
jgi:hypothetical protein